MSETSIHPFETMIVVISRLLKNKEVAVTGTLSPIPTAAVYLAQRTHAPDLLSIIYGDPDVRISDGLHELFGLIQRGMVDVFFFSGIQIDQHGNFNLSVIGDYNKPAVRLPGGAASNMMSMMAKKVIAFTTTHNKKLFVPQVDFVNSLAADRTVPWRRGVLSHIVTPISVLRYDEDRGVIVLDSTYPGVTPEQVAENTGFDLEIKGKSFPLIDEITEEELYLLRGDVQVELRKVYSMFCDSVWEGA